MKTIIFLIAVLLIGCAENPKLKRPFVITGKYINSSSREVRIAEYVFQDGNGYEKHFYDSDSLYHIGDTIR